MTGQGRAARVRRMRTTAPAVATPRALRDRAARPYVLNGHSTSAPPLPSGLYLVATPIGNLRDITVRALEVLAAADLIACEDTRVTRKLLDHYGITTPLAPYHDHNAAEARPKLIARLAEGAAIALVSDAGTPLVSDPGYKRARGGCERDDIAGRLGGARSAYAEWASHRPVLVRGILAGEGRRAARAHQRAQTHSRNARSVRDRRAYCRDARRSCGRAWSAPGRDLPRAHQALRGGPAWRTRHACARGGASGGAAGRDRDRGGAARSASRGGGGRSRCVAASGARASFGQGGRRRNRRRHRRIPPRGLPARARTCQAWPMSARAQARFKFRARSARSRFAPGFQPRAGRRRFSSPKAFASWRGAGGARSAKSTSSPAAAACWCSSRSRRAKDWTTPHGRSPIASACASPPLPRCGSRKTAMTASAIFVSMPCWWRRAVFRVISPRRSTPAADAVG